MACKIVEIFELMNYVDGGSRPFEEGCRILNSNHILMCGLYYSKNNVDKYFALCLRTTSLTNYPHEINIEISLNNSQKVLKGHCTCQAGNSGRCKHIVGVFLFLNTKTKQTIEQLGCTDLRQQWGKIKQKVDEAYAAEPFDKFCHGTQANVQYEKTPEVCKEIFSILCKTNVESELSQHTRCYRTSIESNKVKQNPVLPKKVLKSLNENAINKKTVPVIINLNEVYGFHRNFNESDPAIQIFKKFAENNIWSPYLINFRMKINDQSQAIYYNKYVYNKVERSQEIFLSTIKQSSTIWFQERKKRITGYTCYSLYTYMKHVHTKDEWNKKLEITYKSSFKGNQHTLRGKMCEGKARKAYERSTNTSIHEVGLLILPSSSWFGYSADGIVNMDILIEIKCPKNDNNVIAKTLAAKQSYIENVNGLFSLKKRHPYYGQVQLGMCLYGLENCHFVLYEEDNDTCEIILVSKDDVFIKDMVTTLSNCYFTHILPWLTSAAKSDNSKEN